MRISKSEWFVGFGLWAGAWAFINLLSGILFELQEALTPGGLNSAPFSLNQVPMLEPALSFLVAASAVKNDRINFF